MLAKRWAWLVALGIIICAGVTYAANQFITPTYQASATLVLSVCTTQSTAFDCTGKLTEGWTDFAPKGGNLH